MGAFTFCTLSLILLADILKAAPLIVTELTVPTLVLGVTVQTNLIQITTSLQSLHIYMGCELFKQRLILTLSEC